MGGFPCLLVFSSGKMNSDEKEEINVGKVKWKPTRCSNNSFIDLQDQLNMFRAN
jgi:hypothetical protein